MRFPIEQTKTLQAIAVVDSETDPNDRRRFHIAADFYLPPDIFHMEHEGGLPLIVGLKRGWKLASLLELAK